MYSFTEENSDNDSEKGSGCGNAVTADERENLASGEGGKTSPKISISTKDEKWNNLSQF